MMIPSFKAGIIGSYKIITVGAPPTIRSTVYVFNIFSDTELIINRYDSTDASVTTTARGWFFR